MKKMFAIVLALMLCVSVLSVSAFAAFDTVNSLAIVGEGIPGVAAWDPADPAGDLTEVSDGIYEKTLELPAGTSMNFKIAGNDAWDDTCNFGSANIVLGEVADLECSGGSGNMAFSAEAAMTIKITVDLTGDVATILVENADASAPEQKPEEKPEEKPEQKPEEKPVVEASYYVAGVAGICGAEWDPAAEANKMVKGDDGIYTITYKNVAAGNYSLKVTDGSWNNSWGGTGENGNFDFEVKEAGDVTVKFNASNKQVSIVVGGETLEGPKTGDVSLAAVSVALLAATAGLVVVVSKKKEF